MSSLPELRPMTFDEWLAFEEAHPEMRHELVDGEIYAMTGASRKHNILAGNLFVACHAAALSQGCRAFVSDFKVATKDAGYYPDVMVACGDDGRANPLFEATPCLLVEVLSPSTGRIDKREKLRAYTALDSLEASLVAEPELVRIEVHQRVDGEWKRFLAGPGDQIALTCPQVVLDVDDLYTGVQ